MFGFGKKGRFEQQVLERLGDYLSLLGRDFRKSLITSYPGARRVIETGFDQGRGVDALCIELGTIVLVDVIEKTNDNEWRDRVLRQLKERMTHPDYTWRVTVQQLKDGRYPKGVDNFVYVLEWFLAMTCKGHEEGKIDLDTMYIVSNEVTGALSGKTGEERQGERFVDMLIETFGDDKAQRT